MNRNNAVSCDLPVLGLESFLPVVQHLIMEALNTEKRLEYQSLLKLRTAIELGAVSASEISSYLNK